MDIKKVALGFIFLGLALILFIFGPILNQEVKYESAKIAGVSYTVDKDGELNYQRVVSPVNTDFSITIPKLNTSSSIVANVDASNSEAYLKSLKKGVAHAAGTPYPGQIGNVFLFAHSTDAFYNIARYNAAFFLIGHLKADDEIDIYYHGYLYKYFVYDKKVVEPADVQYMQTLLPGEKTLTLQTCYPPGTTVKRLVVLAKLSDK